MKSETLLRAYVLTGCDITSKLRSKFSAVKSNLENFLFHFGSFTLGNDSFIEAEKYLVKLVELSAKYSNSDELRYHLTVAEKSRSHDFPQQVDPWKGTCCHVVNLCDKLLHPQGFTLEPRSYRW